MPFDDDGFSPRTSIQIIEDYEEKAKDLFTTVNFSPSSLMWQQMKIHALDEYYYETLLETAAEQMSMQEAVGAFLDRHGIECGIKRRGARHAQGYVDVTATIIGAPIHVGEGAEFKSSLNSYRSDENTTIDYMISLTKTKTGESYDYFSSDYPYIGSIVEIRDENNNVLSTSYYEFDTTYHNNIHWLEASSAALQENSNYRVQITGRVDRRVEVTSVESGVVSNAKVGEVSTSVTYPFLTVTNSVGISGGINKELDDKYKTRLLNARRRNFTLEKVESIANDIDGMRSATTYQDKGVDQTSVVDWDNPTLSTDVRVDSYNPTYSQSFVPGDLVLSLGRITLKGKPINSPPPIRCGVRLNLASTGQYLPDAISMIAEEDLDPTVTGYYDINFDLKYNSLDKTKTYRFDLWCHPSEDGATGIDFSTNYWTIRTTTEQYGVGGSNRYNLYRYSGGEINMGTGVDLMFKSWYNGAAYTVTMATDDGFGFENLKLELDEMLDYVDGGGLSPIGIQYTIQEADEINVDIRGIIYVDTLADFATVREDVIKNIETYLESLSAGENVIYAKMEYEIMRHPSVTNQKELYIKRADSTIWHQDDLPILENEIADLGSRNLQRGI